MELDSSMVHRCENPDCEPDPWELLRESMELLRMAAGEAEDGSVIYYACANEIDAALKQHDAERKSDAK